MKITFIGAYHNVTGSCTLVEAAGKRFIVDYGMEQGNIEFETVPLPCIPADIDFVLLTHAHVDHSGMLPLLYKNGFRGPVHATVSTRNLAEIMLLDCAHIHEADAERETRKNLRAGKKPVEPIYNSEDAMGIIGQFVSHYYNETVNIADGIEVRYIDAGHLLGSSSVEVKLTENGVTKKIVFSGDIGNMHQPLLRDPQYLNEADYVVMESTYGNRKHEIPPDYAVALAAILQRTFDRGGNVIIPSFAVGRTQDMLYYLRQIKEKGLVTGHDHFPVYVDSPLAIKATTIFVDNADFCFDEEARALLDAGINPIDIPDLHATVTSEESIAINADATPKVIISASGMCDAGRIRHHLKHNLWRPECTILFVGYQSVGTLGRIIVDGTKDISLMGEKIYVQAEVTVLPGTSAHADVDGLIRWASSFTPKPTMLFINHGEGEVSVEFAKRLTEEFDIPSMAPASGTEYDLANACLIRLTDPMPVEKNSEQSIRTAQEIIRARDDRADAVYKKLRKAFDRLAAVVDAYENEDDQNISSLRNAIYSVLDHFEDHSHKSKRSLRAEAREQRKRAKRFKRKRR